LALSPNPSAPAPTTPQLRRHNQEKTSHPVPPLRWPLQTPPVWSCWNNRRTLSSWRFLFPWPRPNLGPAPSARAPPYSRRPQGAGPCVKPFICPGIPWKPNPLREEAPSSAGPPMGPHGTSNVIRPDGPKNPRFTGVARPLALNADSPRAVNRLVPASRCIHLFTLPFRWENPVPRSSALIGRLYDPARFPDV